MSLKQRIWFLAAIAIMASLIGVGAWMDAARIKSSPDGLSIDMSIREIAPKLNFSRRALALELGLSPDVSKRKPIRIYGVTQVKLDHIVEHTLLHRGGMLKYSVYLALVLGGLIFLVKLGRPNGADAENKSNAYPRTPYVVFLLVSILVVGFLLGKSPNPMEGIVKAVKAMAGFYSETWGYFTAFAFFILLAVIGNKMICGWACPIGALQELIYSLPMMKKIKRKKPPFVVTNTIRTALFLTMLWLLFSAGRSSGTRSLYHNLNPFNLFDLHFENAVIAGTVIFVIIASFAIYRPFCQLICPFGWISWLAERFSIYRVRIDKDSCIHCETCANVCPTGSVKGLVKGKIMPADCFSCGRCLNVCPVDAIQYCRKMK
ncbi:MAG: 4Fe-4S dicluster domain-containing protein [Syntrophaceae bacterium]|nr:4Fe-4S dicluster domain-containing protein [Syntrophaceae bacterium]